jgi:hypothetical protein
MFSTIENNKCDKCDKLPHPSLLIANNQERELVTEMLSCPRNQYNLSIQR